MSLLDLIRHRPKPPVQTCTVRCPRCRNDLTRNGTYTGETPHGFETFRCCDCDLYSEWDFDAITPLLMRRGEM